MSTQYIPTCSHCGRSDQRRYIGGMCKSCYEYRRVHGIDRPFHVSPSQRPCVVCGKVGIEAFERCPRCYSYFSRRGHDRPATLDARLAARDNGLKHCAGCDLALPLSAFHRSSKNTYQARCKRCQLESTKQWYANWAASNPPEQRPCDHCGRLYRPRIRAMDARFCSHRCGNKQWVKEHPDERTTHKRRRYWLERRAYAVGERIAPLDIYERDAWRCGICGEVVDSGLPSSHPDGPTLDHVIPLARGGSHTSANVQLAHSRCNSGKRDRML